ncbi:MAG: gas vesicle protein [Peptococcaceae bacterium]|nr:MAG: gas vesicle protein [Peptococcaceae bacterium]
MEPIRSRNCTLSDLLDRVLEKGLVLNADLIISLADIPLIGVNLRLIIAGMPALLRYGIMADWDEALRAQARKEKKAARLFPVKEENISVK